MLHLNIWYVNIIEIIKKIKEFFVKKLKIENAMGNFAFAFAGGSAHRFCYYIFHQPKMPDELMELNEK